MSHMLPESITLPKSHIVKTSVPSPGANIGYAEVFAVSNQYIWVDVVAACVLPEIMLEVQPEEISAESVTFMYGLEDISDLEDDA